MFERAGGDANSLASDSKQNENEAAICVAYVEQLVRLPIHKQPTG